MDLVRDLNRYSILSVLEYSTIEYFKDFFRRTRNRFAISLRIMEKKMKKSSWKKLKIELSDDSLGDTPVPMPNTEVKLLNAESSWWETACEGR